jgi:hypothetical protein
MTAPLSVVRPRRRSRSGGRARCDESGPLADDVAATFRSGTYTLLRRPSPRRCTGSSATPLASSVLTGQGRARLDRCNRSSTAHSTRRGATARRTGSKSESRAARRSTKAQPRLSAAWSAAATRFFLPRASDSWVVCSGGFRFCAHGRLGRDSRLQLPGEFQRFNAWISEAVRENVLVEVPVESPYSGSSLFDEHWYRAAEGVVWRVVAPEPPFRGVFERVP